MIENLLAACPPRTTASFYRTSAGAEIDLVLELPGRSRHWAVEIKRGLAAKPSRGFHSAYAGLAPERAFVVNSGRERYPVAANVDAIGLREMAEQLAVG